VGGRGGRGGGGGGGGGGGRGLLVCENEEIREACLGLWRDKSSEHKACPVLNMSVLHLSANTSVNYILVVCAYRLRGKGTALKLTIRGGGGLNLSPYEIYIYDMIYLTAIG
jgi:hypothetical protein